MGGEAPNPVVEHQAPNFVAAPSVFNSSDVSLGVWRKQLGLETVVGRRGKGLLSFGRVFGEKIGRYHKSQLDSVLVAGDSLPFTLFLPSTLIARHGTTPCRRFVAVQAQTF